MFGVENSNECKCNIVKITRQMQMQRLRSSIETITLDTRKNKENSMENDKYGMLCYFFED